MTWWGRLTAWGAQLEVETADLEPSLPPGAMSMVVGVYVGLSLGTMAPDSAGQIRRELEVEMAQAMGLPAEALEESIRALIASKVER